MTTRVFAQAGPSKIRAALSSSSGASRSSHPHPASASASSCSSGSGSGSFRTLPLRRGLGFTRTCTGSSIQPSTQPQTRRCFSTSSPRSQHSTSRDAEPNLLGKDKIKGETHYDTLGVPRGASRMEIKAAYFRLSKCYHPDVRRSRAHEEEGKEGGGVGATERFHEVNGAYRVLSDDRQRRAYDRSLSSPSSQYTHPHRTRTHVHGHAHTPGSSYMHASTYEMYRGRKRGATHAWEGPRGYTAKTGYTHAGPTPSSGAGMGTSGERHYDPTYSPFSTQFQSQSQSSQTASGTTSPSTASTASAQRRPTMRLTGRALRAEEERIEHDRIVRESNVSRFFRALGIVLVVSWVGSLANGRGV